MFESLVDMLLTGKVQTLYNSERQLIKTVGKVYAGALRVCNHPWRHNYVCHVLSRRLSRSHALYDLGFAAVIIMWGKMTKFIMCKTICIDDTWIALVGYARTSYL